MMFLCDGMDRSIIPKQSNLQTNNPILIFQNETVSDEWLKAKMPVMGMFSNKTDKTTVLVPLIATLQK